MAKQEEDPQAQGTQLGIELPADIAEGTYSNLAIITHSNTEFVIDFVRIMPGMPQARVKSRILLTPHHAKRLMRALADNISKFETAHSTIDEGDDHNTIPLFYGGPVAEA